MDQPWVQSRVNGEIIRCEITLVYFLQSLSVRAVSIAHKNNRTNGRAINAHRHNGRDMLTCHLQQVRYTDEPNGNLQLLPVIFLWQLFSPFLSALSYPQKPPCSWKVISWPSFCPQYSQVNVNYVSKQNYTLLKLSHNPEADYESHNVHFY